MTERITALCGMAWFVMTIDACFTWFLSDLFRSYIGFFFILLGTLVNGIRFSKQICWMALSVLLLMFYIVCFKNYIYETLKYIPFLLVLLWSPSAQAKMYSYFKKFVVFYAILSIVVEMFFMSGIWKSIPYLTTYPPQDWVQEVHWTINYFYGLFCIPVNSDTGFFYRACGPLREGGHWIFFLGFTYYSELALYGRRNIWLIICGVLTLSPNFVLFFGGAEVYIAYKQKKLGKPLLGLMAVVVFLFFSFPLIPDFIKDDVVRIVLERSLESSLENVSSEGVMAIFDGRAGSALINYDVFEHMDLRTRLFGMEKFDGDGLMSDYRWLLIYSGYIGMVLVLWCTYCFSIGKKLNFFSIFLFIFALTILVQRAWMFNQTYIWVMMFLIMNEKYVLERSDRINQYARIAEK